MKRKRTSGICMNCSKLKLQPCFDFFLQLQQPTKHQDNRPSSLLVHLKYPSRCTLQPRSFWDLLVPHHFNRTLESRVFADVIAMSDRDMKPEEEPKENMDDAGDDEVRDGPFYATDQQCTRTHFWLQSAKSSVKNSY